MANDRDGIQVDLSATKLRLDDQLANTDGARADRLKKLQTVRTAIAGSNERELKRVAEKYGPDDPLVVALGRRIDANSELTKKLGTEAARASTPAPKADPNAWQVHGYVFGDRNRTGVPDLTVSLCDEKGAWVQSAGYSCTDKAGYFTPLGIKRDKPAPTTATDRVEARAVSPKLVFIRVTGPQNTVRFRDTQPTVPSFGAVTYREIILGETPPCLPPEAPPAKDPPAKDPPAKDPPTKDPPAKDPPGKGIFGKGSPGKARTGREDDQ